MGKEVWSLAVNWIDLALLVMIVSLVCLEFRRGFGKAIFDLVALVLALKVTSLFSASLAKQLAILTERQANEALVYFLSFTVIAVALWLLGRIVYESTLISLDTFDPPLGAVLGFGIAVIVGHVIVKGLFLAGSVKGEPPAMLLGSTLGYEFLEFPTYYHVIDFLMRLGE